MKVYIRRYSTDPIIAYVDNVVVKTETFSDGYTYEEKEINMKQVKDIIKGLELLGYHVNKIVIHAQYFDIDTKYYHRCLSDDDIERFGASLYTMYAYGKEVYIKGNRFYMKFDGREIVLPKKMSTTIDDTLCVEFHIEERS